MQPRHYISVISCALFCALLLAFAAGSGLRAQQAGTTPTVTTAQPAANAQPVTGTPATGTQPATGSTPAPTGTQPVTGTPPTVPAPTEPPKTTLGPDNLPLFGRDLFQMGEGNPYEPNPETPVPANYELGAGDTITVVVWYGSNEYEHSDVAITPAGDIYLKLIGSVPMAGRTLAQAEDELRKRYAKFYAKFSLRLQVVGRRTIPVFVMGEVGKQGKYMLSSLATVFTALYAAGGPTDIGSLRTIRLVRARTKETEIIDIYAYLLKGEANDYPLQAGDTVFVPLAGNVVTMAGEVRRPARYELLRSDSLGDALALAGGTTPTSAGQVRISRINANHERQVVNLNLPQDTEYAMQDGDNATVARVLPYVRNGVELAGAVYRPGSYPLEKAPTVGALIKLAEGVTPEAYIDQITIERLGEENVKRVQISVDLRAILEGKENADVKLQPRDIVRVPNRKDLTELLDTVTVEGEVVKPGGYPFQPDLHVSDLVKQAFGLTTKAFLPQAYLYRFPIAGQPQVVTINLELALTGDEKANAHLAPRDKLVIKSRDEVTDLAIDVQGEVDKPGTLTYYQGMKVSDAIFLSGGLKKNVALDRALLIRLNPETYAEELIELNLRDVLAQNATQDLVLQNHDRLMIYPVSQMGERRVVTIEGAVVEPGSYPFTGNMRASHLLFLAKGLRQDAYMDRGDLYRLRADNTIEVIPVNLVQAGENPQTDANPLLMPRDRLVVPTRAQMEEQRLVKVDGFVRNPGSFALTNGMKLSDLLHLAGGLRPDADGMLHIYRLNQDKVETINIKTSMADDKLVLENDPALQTNDLVSVRGNANFVKMTETVTIDGAVNSPGAYPAYESSRQDAKTLYQVLKEAGGMLPDAFPAGIVLYRQQAAIHTDRQQRELIRAMRDLDSSVGIPTIPGANNTTATPGAPGPELPPTPETGAPPPAPGTPASPPTTTPAVDPTQVAKAVNIESISNSLAKVLTTDQGNTVVLVIPPRSMQTQELSQSIPLDAEPLLKSNGKQGDIVLEPGDVIYVPKRPTTVTVLGGVVSNGSVVFQEGKKLNDYLAAVGGISPDGDKSRVVVMRMNGTIMPMKLAKSVKPGDIIIVPTKHMLRLIQTKGPFERMLRTLSELAITYLPFRK